MLRNPCGPPSHRHQISGPCSGSERSRVIPASANRDGRRAGRPGMSRVPGARAPAIVLSAPAGDGGHQSRRPISASPSASSVGQRLGTGASSSSPRPSSESPWRGGCDRSSTRAAALSTSAASRSQVDRAHRVTAGVGLDRRQEPELGDRSTGNPRRARGRCRTGRCCGPARARAARRRCAATARSHGNHGNAQLATSCPAASAMTWLLADEPRLRNAARYCWCHRICWTASRSCSNRPATPGQSSSRRRIQVRLISRMPSSMPLVQLHAGQEGVLPPPGAELARHPVGVRLLAGQEPGGGQQREVLQPGDLPDLLDVAGLLLRAVVDPEAVAAGIGAAPGHRIGEPVGLDQVGPGRRPAPPTRPSAAGPRRRARPPGPARAPARRCPAGSTAPNLAHAGRRRAGQRPARGRTCRRVQAAWSAWSRARQATSAGDIRAIRRAYQPRRDAGEPLTPAPGGCSSRLSPTAIVARVVATSDSTEIGIGPPVRQASMNLRRARPAGPCPGRPGTSWRSAAARPRPSPS